MSANLPTAPRWKLATLFFINAAALGMWTVNFGNVLRAHGLEHIIGYAYACTALAAFISPLAVGALADQAIPPVRLVRWLSLGAAGCLTLLFTAIEHAWGVWAVLGLAQAQAICAAPIFGLSTSIVMAELRDPEREFGPLRALATLGWMVAGWAVSFILHADRTTACGFGAAGLYVLTALFTMVLPEIPPLERKGPRDVFGFAALELFRHRDHRVVFLTAALYNIPMAAFYPFTPIHLTELGIDHATAMMSVGQISEVISMFVLAGLLARWRLKLVFMTGIAFGVLRFGLCALDSRGWLIAAIFLHGFAFTLYYITAQIYLEQRVAPALRARAQALLNVMLAGCGNLVGYIGNGLWRESCMSGSTTHWTTFWLGVSGVTLAVWIFFAVSYRGKNAHPSGPASVS